MDNKEDVKSKSNYMESTNICAAVLCTFLIVAVIFVIIQDNLNKKLPKL
jgi:hypothetical protein